MLATDGLLEKGHLRTARTELRHLRRRRKVARTTSNHRNRVSIERDQLVIRIELRPAHVDGGAVPARDDVEPGDGVPLRILPSHVGIDLLVEGEPQALGRVWPRVDEPREVDSGESRRPHRRRQPERRDFAAGPPRPLHGEQHQRDAEQTGSDRRPYYGSETGDDPREDGTAGPRG